MSNCIKAAEFFSVLSNPVRCYVAWYMTFYGPKTVNDLYWILDATNVAGLKTHKPCLSRNLKRMKEAGILESKKAGKNVFYSVPFHMQYIKEFIEDASDLASYRPHQDLQP